MSDFYVEMERKYIVTCQNCGFQFMTTSPGAAEHAAKEHVEDDHTISYCHLVEITEKTFVGRYLP